jgi:uncharacterized protein
MGMRKNLQDFGEWAVLTGGTSGIGAAFADELGVAGFSLLHVSRRQEALDTSAADLRRRYGIAVETLALDLAAPGAAQMLFDRAVALDAGVLISNVKFGGLGSVFAKTLEQHHEVFRLNGLVNIELAYLFDAHFQSRTRRGAILLVGSTVGLHGTPYAANYSASKAGTMAIAEALNYELRDTGVHVSAMSPGMTDTPAGQSNPDADLTRTPIKPMSPVQTEREGLEALAPNNAHHVVGRLNRVMTPLLGRHIISCGASVSMWVGMLKKMVHAKAARLAGPVSTNLASAH